jgi:hypothetical protein
MGGPPFVGDEIGDEIGENFWEKFSPNPFQNFLIFWEQLNLFICALRGYEAVISVGPCPLCTAGMV